MARNDLLSGNIHGDPPQRLRQGRPPVPALPIVIARAVRLCFFGACVAASEIDFPMNNRAVHWHEGMFLRPHHFNTAQQHWDQVVSQNAKWDLHYNWGLRSIDLDLDALANYRLVIRSLRARLRDGTLVAIPEDGVLPALDLKARVRARQRGDRDARPCRCSPPAGPTWPPPARRRGDPLHARHPEPGRREHRRQPPADQGPPAQPQAPALGRGPHRLRDPPDRPGDQVDPSRGDARARHELLPAGARVRRLAAARWAGSCRTRTTGSARRSSCWPTRSSRAGSRSTARRRATR